MLSDTILQWLSISLPIPVKNIVPLAGDASFRQYYRLYDEEENTFILMANPQDKVSNFNFIEIAHCLAKWGVRVPSILATDSSLEHLLLSDMGDTSLSQALNRGTELTLYTKALAELHLFQFSQNSHSLTLPMFDQHFMLQEMNYFTEWLVKTYLNLKISAEEERSLQTSFNLIAKQVAEQPYLFIHRDYHSRNLMVMANDELSVLDFQDAMKGPITYDLVSLLRDCYYVIDSATLFTLMKRYYIAIPNPAFTFDQLMEWTKVTALQRHLKVAGIFARLICRDGKSQFLSALPTAVNYIRENLRTYPGLNFLSHFIEQRVMNNLVDKTF